MALDMQEAIASFKADNFQADLQPEESEQFKIRLAQGPKWQLTINHSQLTTNN